MKNEYRIDYAEYDSEEVVKGSKALDSVFDYGSTVDVTAYLNWRVQGKTDKEQFVLLGRAFLTSAYLQLNCCLEDNSDKSADLLVFPIMFDVVHGIEVYEKAICASFSCLLGKERKIVEGGHNILQLSQTASALIDEYAVGNKSRTTEQMKSAIGYVKNFVENIYDKTNDMTFARYPLMKNGNGHFYAETYENETIDIFKLKNQLSIVFHMLEFLYDLPEPESSLQAEYFASYCNDWS